jgi:hypothetical protein
VRIPVYSGHHSENEFKTGLTVFRVKALKKLNGMTEESRMDVERVVQHGMRKSRVPFEDTIREAVEKLSR